MRILITGASGSGTSTLGQVFAANNNWKFLDADDYFWMQTTPPYGERREKSLRLEMMLEDLMKSECSVISGSVMNWGAELEDSFDMIVFLYLDAEIRVKRLKQREEERFGKADPAFLQWAAEYDSSPSEGRSLAKHEKWLSDRTCKILRLEGDLSVQQRCEVLKGCLSDEKICQALD